MSKPRIILTGSREWTDTSTVERVLLQFPDHFFAFGDCPAGLDAIVRQHCVGNRYGQGGRTWRRYLNDGNWPSAGPRRNQAMVDDGADLCIAFLKDGAKNRGTRNCMGRAAKAGIVVLKVEGD